MEKKVQIYSNHKLFNSQNSKKQSNVSNNFSNFKSDDLNDFKSEEIRDTSGLYSDIEISRSRQDDAKNS